MLVYPSGLDLSSSHLRYLARHLAARRAAIGSRWRRLSSGRQALLVLAHLRNGHPYAQLAAGFGIGTTTAYRYITEAVEVLAALAPTLAEAVRTASRKAFVLLDGTLVSIDRIAADRPFYSGKHKRHGMNVQILADPFGRLLWASPALPGAVHDVR
ncbi:transposase family protein, partial [Streptomyces sodiiphilus]|uniref:transposase family protein n=1 Tax=Streptomyces sodiiphilus TaxID=226217 RepID=UPI0031E27DBE